jgi:hypothetical protein
MRLLLLNFEYPSGDGGVGTATAHVALTLAALRHSPVAFATNSGSATTQILIEDVEVRRVSGRATRFGDPPPKQ